MQRFLKHLLNKWLKSPKKRARSRTQTKGLLGTIPRDPITKTHNLSAIYDKINARYFEGKLSIPIEWSNRGTIKGRRSRRLGSYCLKRKRILIDGRLDHPHFPEEFIAFLVYHEMLHSLLPPFRLKSGRRAIHHSAFREKEREFQGYEEIKQWEKQHSHLFFS